MKRYVAEPGTDAVVDAMERASAWFACRVAFVEAVRAVSRVAGGRAARAVREEWPAIAAIEVDQALADSAADLAVAHELRSLDALHLAAALLLPRDELVLATWDRRLHGAAAEHGLRLLPEALA